MAIAQQFGVKVSQNDSKESVIYDILDRAAIESAANESASPKKKRTRIAKQDPDHVYSVTGDEGENLDDKPRKRKKAETPSLFADEPIVEEKKKKTRSKAKEEEPATEEAAPAPTPKRRGRKSKAELAAIAAAEAEKAANEANSDIVLPG